MAQSPSTPVSSARLVVRALVLLLVIAIGTPLTLWVVMAIRDPRTFRRVVAEQFAYPEQSSMDEFRPIRAAPQMPVVAGWEILSPQEAEGTIGDEELVLAVEINGEARAWPLNIMTGPEREVFNDRLGGHSIAATW